MTHPTDNPWGEQFNQMSPQDQIESLKSHNASLLATNHEQADKIKAMKEVKPNNPPAFPMNASNAGYEPILGMTLRDYFAGQALASINVDPEGLEGELAEYSYHVADAMLTERSKTDGS